MDFWSINSQEKSVLNNGQYSSFGFSISIILPSEIATRAQAFLVI